MSYSKQEPLGSPTEKEVYGSDSYGADVETGSTSSLKTKMSKYAKMLKMEEAGFEQIPEELQTEESLINAATMWVSANLNVSSLAIGILGISLFEVGFSDGILTILFFNMISILPVAYFSTFGSRLGLRQMIISRFSFGSLGTPLVACLNVLACVGWSASNAIVGGQILRAINHDVHLWAGILLITVLTGFITIFGYKVVHAYEKVSWIPCLAVMLVIIAGIAQSGEFQHVPMGTGSTEAGAVLSFGSSIYGFGTGWTSYAADYTIYQNPNKVKSWKIFIWVYLGLLFPLLFCEMIGLAAGTLLVSTNNPAFAAAYDDNSVGGLTGQILARYGNGGKFCLVVLALSVIANNVPNNYSGAISVQVITPWFGKAPRWAWNILITGVILAIAIPAANHFTTFFENLLNVLAYWLAIYAIVLFEEHKIFRRGFAGYNVADWDTYNKLPLGLAALGALACGVAGMVVGMYQTWWEGPIAKKIGPYGGDVGFELSLAFAGISYPFLRWLELKFIGR